MNINELSDKNNSKEWALAYAERGYRVFPCQSMIGGICSCGNRDPEHKGGKHPATKHGFQDATCNEHQIKKWWDASPWCNIGIATGDSFLVLDIDPRHGGDKTLAELEAKHGKLPDTPCVRTGGGGEQYCFCVPTDLRIRSRSGIAPGIDVRCESGYVIAPPSMHASGSRYEWIRSLDTPLADAPDWVVTLCKGIAKSDNPAKGAKVFDTPSDGLFVVASSEDLLSHKGESEGRRNATLCRLVGVQIANGDSESTIERLAVLWAERCSPPLSEAEALKVVRSLVAKEQAKQEQHNNGGCEMSEKTCDGVNALDSGFLDSGISKSKIQESTDSRIQSDSLTLHTDAYHGLIGEILRAITPETEADPAGILLTLLSCLGVSFGKSPHFRVCTAQHTPLLYCCLVGDTASRKGMAWDVAHAIMKRADPEWDNTVAYGLSSGEGLIERVQDPEIEDDDKQQPAFSNVFAIPPAPPENRLLCYESEFAKPITAMRREGNTLSPVLRSAWDNKTLEVLTRGKSKLRAKHAHIGIVGNITPEELGKLITNSVDVYNGFVNRFLWGLVRRQRLLPHSGDPEVLEPFFNRVAQAIVNAKGKGKLQRSAEANKLWEDVYPVLTAARPGRYGSATARAEPQVMRIALVYALIDGSDTVGVEHLRAALAVWSYCDASAKAIFGNEHYNNSGVVGGTPEPLHVKLLNMILQCPGITRSDLNQSVSSAKRKDIPTALEYLSANQLAEANHVDKVERWYPVGSPPDDDDGGTLDSVDSGFSESKIHKIQKPNIFQRACGKAEDRTSVNAPVTTTTTYIVMQRANDVATDEPQPNTSTQAAMGECDGASKCQGGANAWYTKEAFARALDEALVPPKPWTSEKTSDENMLTQEEKEKAFVEALRNL